ncbi:MAG TPA: DEAD/DEAH box helicase [Thermoanaerobaculia bacterium]|jgi:ATP-dependent Lhr-like helicase|nr:DEAD/DEAH box helicase [Thermoanaerobaculia bacterium]
MTISPPSGSDGSSSFEWLHERVRRWIWDQQWSELRDVQETAIRTILGTNGDAIITAATAAGKTEAAFLPICSTLVDDETSTGVQVLYIGPLKALINDQWRRLDGLCESLEIPVHRWHGDVTSSARMRLIRQPDGILLITPESLEAMFVRRGSEVGRIFAGLRFVVIDELHAFIGSERGMQLQSLLHRIELVLHRTVRRIGLSATLGDMTIAADFLRPPNRRTTPPEVVKSEEAGAGMKLKLYGFRRALKPEIEVPEEDEEDETARSIAQHLFKNLRGANNLVFANARGSVEKYTDLLSRMCESASLPQEFFAHHGSLSRELRFDVEDQLKRGDRPLTVICTSTLEMGIDIGAVTSVAQIGPPPNVASLRQRLGRSGRRGEPAVLRLYIEEATVTERSSPQEAIRATLVETIAMMNLLLEKWVEPPPAGMLHGSTFVQQFLSLIAQHGGVSPSDAYAMLCAGGPFHELSKPMFMGLLRTLSSHELIEQTSNQELHLGAKGEKYVNTHDFYTAFFTADEYRLMTAGTNLGTLPIVNPIDEGSFLIFAGRRWRIVSVDQEKRVIDLVAAGGGRVPIFDGASRGNVHDRVRREMLAIYTTTDVPRYLDATASDLLHEGRENFARYALDRTSFIRAGDGALYFPWYGSLAMNTLVQQFAARGIRVSAEGPAIAVEKWSPEKLRDAVDACESERPVDTLALAANVKNKEQEKWDWALDEETLCASYASRSLSRNPLRGALRKSD